MHSQSNESLAEIKLFLKTCNVFELHKKSTMKPLKEQNGITIFIFY